MFQYGLLKQITGLFVFSMPRVITFKFINHFNLHGRFFKNLLQNKPVNTFTILTIVVSCIVSMKQLNDSLRYL